MNHESHEKHENETSKNDSNLSEKQENTFSDFSAFRGRGMNHESHEKHESETSKDDSNLNEKQENPFSDFSAFSGRGMNHERHEQHENEEEKEDNTINGEKENTFRDFSVFRGGKMNQDKLIFKDECYAIQGAIFEVYREMGCGFLEGVYQECMEKELQIRGIPFQTQPDIKLVYKGTSLKQAYKPDLICFGKIILELKAVKEIATEHEAQLLNYLKATRMKLGLLVNFGSHPKATVRRFAL